MHNINQLLIKCTIKNSILLFNEAYYSNLFINYLLKLIEDFSVKEQKLIISLPKNYEESRNFIFHADIFFFNKFRSRMEIHQSTIVLFIRFIYSFLRMT